MNTRKPMIVVCVLLIFATIGVSIYHVSHELGRYDGGASLVLGALMGAINAIAAWSFLEVPRSRWVSTPTFIAAAGVSMWLQIRFYQRAGAPELDAYILGAWCPAFELMLGGLFAKLTAGGQFLQTEPVKTPGRFSILADALTSRLVTEIAPVTQNVPVSVSVAPTPDISTGAVNGPEPVKTLHVPGQRQSAKERKRAALIQYLAGHPYATDRDMAEAVGGALSTVQNYRSELETAGTIHKNGNGWEVMA